MTDNQSQPITERLRQHFAGSGIIKSSTFDLLNEAADRIEELEAALREIIIAFRTSDPAEERMYYLAVTALDDGSSGVARTPTERGE